MEYEKIKKLMDDMGNSKLTALDIDFPDGTKISMKKENETFVTETKIIPSKEKSIEIENSEEKKDTDENGKFITSPMVGTFYLRPEPNADPYVEVGKRVKKGDTLCIIEAMKLMNEIESDLDGEIAEICVEDGKPVEYGAPLFRVK